MIIRYCQSKLFCAVLLVAGTLTAQPLGVVHIGCNTWESKYNTLSDKDKSLLNKDGVLYRGGWIFSRTMVTNCEQRARVAWYFERVIQGNLDESVVRFGWLNAGELSLIVSRVWPLIGFSPAIPTDGSMSSEAWALLRQPWLETKVLSKTLKREIQSKGLSPEAILTLLNRPIGSLGAVLNHISSGDAADVQLLSQVGATVLLEIVEGKKAEHRLKVIESTRSISKVDQAVIARLRQKSAQGQPVLWSDLEPLVKEW